MGEKHVKRLSLFLILLFVLGLFSGCVQSSGTIEDQSPNENMEDEGADTDLTDPGETDSEKEEAAGDNDESKQNQEREGTEMGNIEKMLPLTDPKNEGNWVLYEPMSDEFEGDQLDSEKWWPNNPEWKGRQPGYFYPGNVEVSDGKLNLTMKNEEPPEMPKGEGYHTYTCAAVKSKTEVLYGYFEVKAKAMNSAGSSAFWFYNSTPERWTEIDVFEIGGRSPGFERKYNMNLHVFRTPEEDRHWDRPKIWMAPWDLAEDYHVYGLDWGEELIKFYVDGELVWSTENTAWHQPLYMNFDSETMPEWFGLPKDDDLPSTYSIEYVRAWKKA